MSNRYLMQAPTLIVIGVAAFAALPTLLPGGDSSPPKAGAKPPSTAKESPPTAGRPARNPFLVERPPVAPAGLAANSPAVPIGPSNGAKPMTSPTLAADEDKILGEMRLGGTFIGGRDRIAIIDDRVYARGERLRKADGSPLPYVIAEVRKDHAVLRRGRRDFVLAFSNAPRTGDAKVIAPALAKSTTPANAPSPAKIEPGSPKKDASPSTRPGAKPNDQAAMLLQMLTNLGGTSGSNGTSGAGGSAASGVLSTLLGGASGTNPTSMDVPINQNSIQAGIDALLGKYDNIGRSGDTSGGTTP
jgi:hypothetical protein